MNVAEERSFEVEWPPVADRLAAALRQRRVPEQLAEDLIQETGLRLFQFWDRVDPGRDLWPLALTITLNILRDQIRADSRRRDVVVPEDLVEHDTETAALARIELGRVQEALIQLTAPQRSVLLAEVGAGAQPHTSPSATKMLRMRARKRLRSLMEGASAAVGALGHATQKGLRWGSSSGVGEQLGPATSVAAGVIWATALGGVGVVVGGNLPWGSSADAAPAPKPRMHNERRVAAETPDRRAVERPRGEDRVVRDWLTPLDDGSATEKRSDRQRDHSWEPRSGERPGARPPSDGVRVHEPRVRAGGDGYDVRGGVSSSAVGRSARAVFHLTSRADERRSAGGCAGVNAPGALCTRPSGRAQAEVEDLDPVDVRFKRGTAAVEPSPDVSSSTP